MVRETNTLLTRSLPNGLATVEQEIARACKDARRDRAPVTLIAVSKTFDETAISPVIDAGQRVFGENRVQEAKAKWPALMSAHPGLVLHLIGPLQSNKAKEAVALFDAIHSVDRPSICEALAKEIKSQGRNPELFVQLNTGEESQKAGVAPSEADVFIANCREKYVLPISVLMCIPRFNEAPSWRNSLASHVSAMRGSPRTFLPCPMNCWPRIVITGLCSTRSSDRQSAVVAGPSTNRCAQALSAISWASPAPTKSANRESGISIAGCSVSTASSTCCIV